MKNTIEQFAAMVQAEHEARHASGGVKPELYKDWSKTTIKPGKKFTKVDVGTSGKYMVENETGNIFGIKGYGVVHRGHWYGTLDTIDDYYWGEFYPVHKTNPVGCCKWSVPKLTFAPEPVATV